MAIFWHDMAMTWRRANSARMAWAGACAGRRCRLLKAGWPAVLSDCWSGAVDGGRHHRDVGMLCCGKWGWWQPAVGDRCVRFRCCLLLLLRFCV